MMPDPKTLLQVDGSIAYGNVADVEVTGGERGPVVAVAADAKGGPERAWFCFRIAQPRRGRKISQPITLVLKHLQTMRGGGDPSALQPVVRYAAADWQRLPPGKPAPTDDGRLGAWWTLEPPISFLDVALSYPYGQPDIAALVQETGSYGVETIGVSEGGRPMLRLANRFGSTRDGRSPGVYLIARQHAGETPGSWVLDGLLRRLAEAGPSTPTVWAVPLVDIDGIEAGRCGRDHPARDHDRAWREPPTRHEAAVLQADAPRWAARCHPRLMLDLHASGVCDVEGFHAKLVGPTSDEDWAALFRERLDDLAGDPFGHPVASAAPRAEGRATHYFAERIGCPAMAIVAPYGRCGARLMNRDDYREAGARLAEGILQRLG